MKITIGKVCSALLLLTSTQVFATAYQAPPPQQSIIGHVRYDTAHYGDNVVKFAKHYDLGYNAIVNANPHLTMQRQFPSGASVQIPTQHLLPNQPRQGIIINLPEMRMYYFPAGTNAVYTYPIGIGKIGKTIPITKTSITRKATDPTWTPPDDIREFNLKENGIVLPQVMPPGPDNPLGPYAIYMRVPTYLIHSTIFPESVGKRASFGCIRMYERDIKEFFPSITSGIPVAIINDPVKLGWQNNRLFMEAHQPLEEHNREYDSSLPGIVHRISSSAQNQPVLVDWQLISYIAREHDGLPHEVGVRLSN